jgi:hypothetical protein
MPRPSHPPWYDHPNYIWWSVQVMKFLIMQSLPASRHFFPLRSCYRTPSIYVLPLLWETKFYTHQQLIQWHKMTFQQTTNHFCLQRSPSGSDARTRTVSEHSVCAALSDRCRWQWAVCCSVWQMYVVLSCVCCLSDRCRWHWAVYCSVWQMYVVLSCVCCLSDRCRWHWAVYCSVWQI